MYCKKCGEDNPDEAKFCKNCGEPLKEEKKAKKVEVVEAPSYQSNDQQNTRTTRFSTDDSSTWIGCCCLGLIVVFILSALFSGI